MLYYSRKLYTLIIVASIIAIILNSNHAYAHPLLIESNPANLQRLSSAPSSVVIVFSEPVEAKFSWIRVYDSSNNRVDNNDTNYVDNNPTKLGVTLKPLSDGLYTVNTRVLSQVDGHIVDYTFIFIVGDATLSNISNNNTSSNAIRVSSEQIILPDAIAKFPAYIAQVMVVGLAVVALYLWKPLHTLLRIPYISISRVYKVTIIAGIMLIASSIALAVTQSISLNTGIEQVLTSKFGSMLLLRLVGGVSLLVLAYAIARKRKKDEGIGREEGKEKVEKGNATVKRLSIALLIIGSSVIVSTTLVSHSAAVSIESTAVDLIHNILASIWIGGVIALAFVVMPSIKQAVKDSIARGYALSLTIPRFSQLALLSIGILGITGPLVLWGIESDIVRLLQTEYGLILSIKLALAALMVILGGYSTFKVHKKVISILNINTGKGYAYQDNSMDNLYSYANSLLKLEAYVGIALLLSVALLTNTVPPEAYTLSKLSTASIGAGSIGEESLGRSVNLTSTVGDSNVELTIKPARLGINSVYVVVKDSNGNELKDLKSIKLKVRPNITDIGPVTYELVKDNNTNAWFSSNVALTSNGLWRFEVNAERESALNISASFDVMIKPDLSEMRFDVKEYQMPYRDSIPFYILYSKEDNAIWVSDGNRASVWMLDLASEQFKEYRFNGTISTILARDSHGRIWFLDPASKAFGYIDPSKYSTSNDARIFSVPYDALAVYIYIDSNDRIWLSLVDKGSIIMYNSIEDVERGDYKEFKLPQGFVPTYITSDALNNIWFTATTNNYGVIGMIDTSIDSSKGGKEEAVRLLDHRLSEPLAMHISSNGSIWVSEHVGSPARITYIDPLLGIVNSYSVIDNNALPYGIIQDKLGNVWFAQHTVDKIGVLDSYRGKIREVNTLSKGAFVQWITVDDDGKVWYAASRAASIGVIKWSAIEVSGQEQLTTAAIRDNNSNSSNNNVAVTDSSKRYVEIFAPSLALLITSVSFIYLRSSSEYHKTLKIIKNK